MCGPNSWEEVWPAIDAGRSDVERNIAFLPTDVGERIKSKLDRFCSKGLLDRDVAAELA